MAVPDPNLKVPGNPHYKDTRSTDEFEIEIEIRCLTLSCEISDHTLWHAWAGEFDLLPLLTGAEEETILEAYYEDV